MYAEALLHKTNQNAETVSESEQTVETPVGSLTKRFGYLSDDDDN